MSEPKKQAAYARLLLACKYHPEMTPLEQEEAIELNRGFKKCGFMHSFAKRRDSGRICFVRVDRYPATRPRTGAQCLRNDILKLARNEAVEDLMLKEEFEYVWITATKGRAESVIREFRTYTRVGRSPLSLVVMPELIPLAMPWVRVKEVL